MHLTDQINAALQLDQLDLPPKPRVVRLGWDYYEDNLGEDSLKIQLILADDTTDEELEDGPAIKRAIRDRLRNKNIELFPHFRIALESEFEALQNV